MAEYLVISREAAEKAGIDTNRLTSVPVFMAKNHCPQWYFYEFLVPGVKLVTPIVWWLQLYTELDEMIEATYARGTPEEAHIRYVIEELDKCIKALDISNYREFDDEDD